jgi:hypothetical protein
MTSETSQAIAALHQTAQALTLQVEGVMAAIAILQKESTLQEFHPPAKAAELTGRGISPRKIENDRADGWFKYGRDWIDTSNGTRPSPRYCPAALQRFYDTPPEQRSKPRANLRAI